MYQNPDSFLGQGGYAAAMTQAARHVADEEGPNFGIWREVPEDVAALGRSEPSLFFRALGWSGDRLIAFGGWLKTQAGPTTYQHA